VTFSVTVQLGQSLLKRTSDLIFLLLTVLLVHWLHVSVMVVLLVSEPLPSGGIGPGAAARKP